MDLPAGGRAAVGEARLARHPVIALDVAIENGAVGEGCLAEHQGACHRYSQY
ncbi:hypothetical protein [Pseudomonas sp. H3_H08]